MLLSLAVSALLANVLLKNVFARERPFADPLSPFYTYWRDAESLAASGFSFPSGHTAAAIVVTSRRSIAWTAFFLPLVMGLSRVCFGVHYASDVLAAIQGAPLRPRVDGACPADGGIGGGGIPRLNISI